MRNNLISLAGTRCLGILVAVILCCTSASAQNSPFWSGDGNSNVTSATYLGTNIAEPLIFKTNRAERLRIGSAGELFFSAFTSNGSGLFTFNNEGRLGSLLFPGTSGLVLTGMGTFEDVSAVTGWNTDGSSFLKTGEDINVGIGIDGEPEARLHVNGDARISSLASDTYSYVVAGPDGNLLSVGGPTIQQGPDGGPSLFIPDPWVTIGNVIDRGKFIGTLNNEDFVIKTDNTEKARVTVAGNFTVGTNATARITMGGAEGPGLNWGSSYLGFNASRDPYTGIWTAPSDLSHNGGAAIWSNMVGQMYFAPIPSEPSYIGLPDQQVTDATVYNNVAMTISPEGLVGIGLANPHPYYKLSVKGKIIAEELRVRLYADWPDYVFQDNYKLMPLAELESFINTNKHLPNIPSAEKVSNDEGFDVGAMQAKHLEKTEELYLYMIQMNRELQALKKENEEQRAQIQSLLGK